MKLTMNLKGTVVAFKRNENKKDPTKPYFNISIESNDEVDSFSCPQEVFDKVQKYKEYDFVGIYDSTYKYFRIASCELIGK